MNKIKIISLMLVLLIVFMPVSFALSITNVEYSNITDNSAIIKWKTDELSNSSVYYGNSTNLTLTKDVSESVLNHSVLIDNLFNNTLYYFAVQSNNTIANNSNNFYSFTTLQAQSNIPLFLNVSIPEYVNTRYIDIGGTTKPNVRVLVYLNNNLDRAYQTLDGNFDFTNVDIIDNSANSIVVKIIDTDNTNITKSFTVTSDLIAPNITITQQPSSLINVKNVSVSGAVSEYCAITISVNRTNVYSSNGTSFSATVNIAEGYNLINILAVDRAGNYVSKDISLSTDTIPPAITKIDPPTGTSIYDSWAKSATISGTTEPNAIVNLFVKKDYEKNEEKTTTADSEGSFRFTKVDLFSNMRFSGNIDNDTFINPQNVGTALGKINVSITSKDLAGWTASSNVSYTIMNCWSGDFIFHIAYLPETAFPTMLNPDRLADGSEQISFWIDVNYTGSDVSEITSLDLTSLCNNAYIKNNPQYNISCQVLPSSYTTRKNNEDKTKWYFVYKLNKLSGTDSYTQADWENLYKSIANTVRFPFQAKLTFKLSSTNQTMQTQCMEIPYTLDNSKIDPRDVLPHWLMYDMVTNLEKAIKVLSSWDTQLRSITKYIGISCIASFLGYTVIKWVRIFSCKVGEWTIKTGAKTEACTADFDTVPSQNKMTNDELKDCHAGCNNLWQSEAWLYKSMRLTCDRLWGHTTPAGWTDTADDSAITEAIRQGDVCGSENLGKGIVLQEEKNCKIEGEKEILPICYKYKAEGKELYYSKSDQDENKQGLYIATLTCKGTECQKIQSSQSWTINYQKLYAVKESNKYLAALPYDCEYMCTKKYSYSKGLVQNLIDGKCTDSNKQGIPFGYTQDAWQTSIDLNKVCCCYDAKATTTISNYYSQSEVEELSNTPLIDENSIWGNYDYRYAILKTNYQPVTEGEVGGKSYNPNRYYRGRDWTACFGMDSVADYIKKGEAGVVMIYPSKNLISSIQCIALGPVVARITQIKNILTALKNCLISVRTTGTSNTAVCKEIFSRYICQSISDIVVAATKGCGTSMAGKLVGSMDEDGNYVGLAFGSIGQAIDESSSVLTEEYDNTKLGNLIGAGVDQVANKICMAAFGYDWDLSLQGVLDASYETTYSSFIMSTPDRKDLTGIDPDTGIANYAYRIVWGISPGCDLSGARIDLSCVTRKELNERAGVSCTGSADENLGCDCLDLTQEMTLPYASEGTITQGQFKEGGLSKTVAAKYRYDHVKITLTTKDKDAKDKCMPEDNKDGIFYFPIADMTGRDIADCRADYTTGVFYCSTGEQTWNKYGKTYYVDITAPKEGQIYYERNSISITSKINTEVAPQEGYGLCEYFELKRGDGNIISSYRDLNVVGEYEYGPTTILSNAKIPTTGVGINIQDSTCNVNTARKDVCADLKSQIAYQSILQDNPSAITARFTFKDKTSDNKIDLTSVSEDSVSLDGGTETTIKDIWNNNGGLIFKLDNERIKFRITNTEFKPILVTNEKLDTVVLTIGFPQKSSTSSNREDLTLITSIRNIPEGGTCDQTTETDIAKKNGVAQKKTINFVLKPTSSQTLQTCTDNAKVTADAGCSCGGTSCTKGSWCKTGVCGANECAANSGECILTATCTGNRENLGIFGCTTGNTCCKKTS